MFISLPMVLIADRDSFSNSTLSHELRKLELADSVICTTSASNALAYLYKQQICNYPFPNIIFYNPSNLEIDVKDFINSFKVAFSDQFYSKFVLLKEKNDGISRSLCNEEALIQDVISKPICSERLLRLFKGKVKSPVHI